MVAQFVASWQPSLLTEGPIEIDATFAGRRRRHLDDSSWVDVVPGWLKGADDLFAYLIDTGAWHQRRRWMYERHLDEPRLTAGWRIDGVAIHSVVDEMCVAISTLYGVEFDSGGMNLYRDGSDSVAWHRDRIAAGVVPLVAIVTLGNGRPFRLRPFGGGRSIEIVPQAGDLLVTGGRCQRDWEHCVPKVAAAAPRMSVTFRPSHPTVAPDTGPPAV